MKEFLLVFVCFAFLGGVIYFIWDRRIEYFAGSGCNLYRDEEKDGCYMEKAVRSGSLFFCEKIENDKMKIDCNKEVQYFYE